MVFGGGQFKTVKKFQQNVLFFLSRYRKNVFSIISRFLFNKSLLVLSIKVILYSKASKYLRDKTNFLDENPKTRFSDMKNCKKPQKYKNVLKKIY